MRQHGECRLPHEATSHCRAQAREKRCEPYSRSTLRRKTGLDRDTPPILPRRLEASRESKPHAAPATDAAHVDGELDRLSQQRDGGVVARVICALLEPRVGERTAVGGWWWWTRHGSALQYLRMRSAKPFKNIRTSPNPLHDGCAVMCNAPEGTLRSECSRRFPLSTQSKHAHTHTTHTDTCFFVLFLTARKAKRIA